MKQIFFLFFFQTGKSTLLRRCLLPYRHLLGGFSSQRLLNREGDLMGFRITSARDFALTRPYTPGLPGIFMLHRNGNVEKRLEVFAGLGVRLLRESLQSPIILLDEIGGAELLVPSFRQALQSLLASGIPCLGVLKAPENTVSMVRGAGYPAQLIRAGEDLRNAVTEQYGAGIISYTASSADAAEREITAFLSAHFARD